MIHVLLPLSNSRYVEPYACVYGLVRADIMMMCTLSLTLYPKEKGDTHRQTLLSCDFPRLYGLTLQPILSIDRIKHRHRGHVDDLVNVRLVLKHLYGTVHA